MKTQSTDGTVIEYERVGAGPAVVLVGGAFNDRNARASGAPLAALLASRFSVLTYDRRGRGGSGDTPPYAVEREVEDLAAVISVVGGSASVYGISSGAVLALDAALSRVPITKLAMYEPPLVDDARAKSLADVATKLAEMTTADRRADAVELFLTRIVQMPPPVVANMRAAPMWGALESLAHTLSYDVRITLEAPALVARAAELPIDTIVMSGSASPPWMRDAGKKLAETFPRGRAHTLEGQTHDVDPKILASALVEFFST